MKLSFSIDKKKIPTTYSPPSLRYLPIYHTYPGAGAKALQMMPLNLKKGLNVVTILEKYSINPRLYVNSTTI